MTSRLLLGLGGVIALIGSFMSWASFSLFFSFLSKTGIELGYGVASALFSLVVIISATWQGRVARRSPRLLDIAAPLGIVGVTVVAAVALRYGLPGLEFHGYRLGLAATALGGGIACVGVALSRRHRRVDST